MITRYFRTAIAFVTLSMLSACFDVADKVAPASGTELPPPAATTGQNSAPTISGIPNPSAIVGRPWSFTPSASDPDGDTIVFSIRNRPMWANFDEVSGRLSGIPQFGQHGDYAGIEISAADGQTSAVLPAFTINVQSTSTNNAPVISGTPPAQVVAGQAYLFQPDATDADGDQLSFRISNQPAWAAFDAATGQLSGTPAEADVGTYANVVISVEDGQQSVSLPIFSINVQATIIPNRPPQISGTASTLAITGQMYVFQPNASDPDGDNLSFAIVNKPSWAAFSTLTGALGGTPAPGDAGTFERIEIFVSDGQLTTSLPTFSIVVQNPVAQNEPPQISGRAATMASVGVPYAFVPSASDPDGDNLLFSITNRPAWATFDVATGALTGTPADGDESTYPNIMISVSDGVATASLAAFVIVVDRPVVNGSPTISGNAATTATVGQMYTFQPTASDPDGDDLTFSINNLPDWAAFGTTTGALTGIPGAGSDGVYQNITITVSDGEDSVSLPTFSITVTDPMANEAPQISGSPPGAVTVGEQYAFQPAALDPDGDDLTFSVSNLPAWATFDSTTGRLSGSPAEDDEGFYAGIIVSVSDGMTSVSLPPFSITVAAAPANQAPSISGNPVTSATVSQVYMFQPSANDPDGDTLSFSIENQPAWASFDPVSGILSGTPDSGDAALYSSIIISVSDGELTTSLAIFSITVTQAATGSATLSWTAPTANTDGSPLTDLAGYKISYGTSPGDYPVDVELENPGITMYVIDGLTANTYYFVIRSVNSQDVESDISNEASKTVD